MTVYSWNNSSGGDFSEASNWTSDKGGVPGSDDTALFSVGGTYTVNMGGQDFRGLTTSDNLTLEGPFNVSDGIGGSSIGGAVKTLTLTGGIVTAGLGINGDALVLKEASVTANTIGNGTSISVVQSAITTTGDNDGFVAEHQVTIAASTFRSGFISLGYTSNDATFSVTGSTFRAVENGDNSGLIYINGSGKFAGTKANADVEVDIGGAITWSGGSIKTDLLRLHQSSNGLDDIDLKGVSVQTDNVSGALNGSANPATLTVNGGSWVNDHSFESSGKALFENADLVTATIAADPEMGAGATLKFVGSNADLTVKQNATMEKLTLLSGGDADIGGELTLVSDGSVMGGSSSLKVQSLTVSLTPLQIESGGSVVVTRTIEAGGITIGENASLHTRGATKNVVISFEDSHHNAELEIGKIGAFHAKVANFDRGDTIEFNDLDAHAKMSVKLDDGNTILTFKEGGKTAGEFTLFGDYSKDRLDFDAKHGTLTVHGAQHSAGDDLRAQEPHHTHMDFSADYLL